MKAIGIIVLLLVVGIGAATLALTKEPDRDLDAQGHSWVAGYEEWHGVVLRRVEVAQRRMTLTNDEMNARLLEPLRGCGRSLARVGEPPVLLEEVQEAAVRACGEAEVALAKNDEFGGAALATTRLHLNEVEDNLRLSQHSLKLALDEPL